MRAAERAERAERAGLDAPKRVQGAKSISHDARLCITWVTCGYYLAASPLYHIDINRNVVFGPIWDADPISTSA